MTSHLPQRGVLTPNPPGGYATVGRSLGSLAHGYEKTFYIIYCRFTDD